MGLGEVGEGMGWMEVGSVKEKYLLWKRHLIPFKCKYLDHFFPPKCETYIGNRFHLSGLGLKCHKTKYRLLPNSS